MSETQESFIKRQLKELAPKFDVPPTMVPDLMHLMEEYPDLERPGRLSDLVDELEKLFENERRAGRIRDA